MDGTTAGSLGAVPLTPPTPAPAGSNLLSISHTAPVPPQPQFSQLTPVYAPTPTNTVADIPQPAVKGIEFVQPAPVMPVAPLSPPLPPPLPPSPPSPSPSQQLMQRPAGEPQPVTSPLQTTASAPTVSSTAPVMSGAEKYANIENHLEDVDLDQTLGAANALKTQDVPISPVVPIASTAPEPAVVGASMAAPLPTSHDAAVRTYFQTDAKTTTDVPVTPTGFSLKNLNPILIRRVAIIAGIVIVLGVGGYFGVNAIMGGHKSSSTATTKTPVVTQPSFNEQSASANSTTDTTGSSSSATTPTTDTTTPATTTADTTTPAVTTDTTTTAPTDTTTAPAVVTTTPTAPAAPTTNPPDTGIEW